MSEQFYTIMTDAGLAAFANAPITQAEIDFAKVAVGDGNGSYYTPTKDMTTLKNKVWEHVPSSVQLDPEADNRIVVTTIIPSTVGGFTIREVGVFDSNDTLLAIGKMPETFKPVMSQGSAKDLSIEVIFEVTNASSVVIKVNPTFIYASKKYVDEKIGNHIPDPVAHVRFGIATGVNVKSTIIVPTPAALVDGLAVSFKNVVENTDVTTLNVNGLGARPIVKANGLPVTPGGLKANGIYTVRYNATTQNFILQGEGGEYGNATVHDVLAGKTFGTEDGILIGELIKGRNWAEGIANINTNTAHYSGLEGMSDGTTCYRVSATGLSFETPPKLIFVSNSPIGTLGTASGVYFGGNNSQKSYGMVTGGSSTGFTLNVPSSHISKTQFTVPITASLVTPTAYWLAIE